MPSEALFIGLMTGTSLDGVDAVLARITAQRFELLHQHSHPLPSALRQDLQRLCRPGDNEIDRAGPAHRSLGLCYAHSVNALLDGADVEPAAVNAIGCHGQTVRHRPGENGFSLQLGCADTLATETGITVINDFRNKDMVLGGQGAPLAPRFHQFLFGRPGERTVVLNLGGIANVSLLEDGKLLRGFDTGPANTLLDLWHQRHRDEPYDTNGQWAAGGTVIDELLGALLTDPYFSLPAPKSTGREYFHAGWLAPHLRSNYRPLDVQATLAELTACSVAGAIADFTPQRLLVCGGGGQNGDLMKRLDRLTGLKPESTAVAGLDPDWVEASAFAWLAWAFRNRIPGNAPAVTGARCEAILGHLTRPD